MVLDDVRAQIRQAIEEGRATAARTQADLTARFESAKHGTSQTDKS